MSRWRCADLSFNYKVGTVLSTISNGDNRIHCMLIRIYKADLPRVGYYTIALGVLLLRGFSFVSFSFPVKSVEVFPIALY